MLQCLMEVRDNLWESVFSFSCVDPGIELKSSDLVTSTPICRDIYLTSPLFSKCIALYCSTCHLTFPSTSGRMGTNTKDNLKSALAEAEFLGANYRNMPV